MVYMNTKSSILSILLIAGLAVASGCKKKKDVELSEDPSTNPSGETNITGSTWTSIASSFVANERIMAMETVNNKILLTYLDLSSLSATYTTSGGLSHSGQDASTGSGLEKIQIADGTPFGLGLNGVYGAWSYDDNASGYPWEPAVSVGTDVYSVEKYDGDLIAACGMAPYVRNISDGGGELGGSFNASVSDMVIYDGKLIAAGGFTTIDSETANRVAQWDGSSWVPLGSGLSGGAVYDLVVYGSKLIAVGKFTENGDGNTACRYVAQWDGSEWTPLQGGLTGGLNGAFKACVYGTQLFIGGDFDSANGVFSPNVIKWNGSSWIALAGGAPDIVGEMCIYNDHLYIANRFNIPGGNFLLRLE